MAETEDSRVIRVVNCIRNDTRLNDLVFTREVYLLIRDGSEDKALEIIRHVIPTAAKKIRVELSDEEKQMTAAIALERARKIQKLGEWERMAS